MNVFVILDFGGIDFDFLKCCLKIFVSITEFWKATLNFVSEVREALTLLDSTLNSYFPVAAMAQSSNQSVGEATFSLMLRGRILLGFFWLLVAAGFLVLWLYPCFPLHMAFSSVSVSSLCLSEHLSVHLGTSQIVQDALLLSNPEFNDIIEEFTVFSI